MSNKSNNKSNKGLFLNGPINYIKLYNKDKDQTVILLMDYHVSIDKQKKCEEYDAKDVNLYIYKELKETITQLDFFLEIVPTEINNIKKYYSNDNYINETKKIFKKIYMENQSKPNSNVRLHYIDIRDYAFIYNIVAIIKKIISILESNKLDQILLIIEQLNYTKSILEFVNNYIELIAKSKVKYKSIDHINLTLSNSKNNQNNSKETNNFNEILNFGFIELLDKILNQYIDLELKSNINKYFNDNYIEVSKKLIIYIKALIDKILKIYESIDKSQIQQDLVLKEVILNNKLGLKSKYIGYGIDFFEYEKQWEIILNEVNKLHLMIINIGSVFMDCFFLRRLLEKNQIKNSIVYTGISHSVMYVWFLVKYYNYTIQDYYYISKEKLDKKDPIKHLEKIIKNSKSSFDIFKYIVPSKFSQCIKIN